MDHNNHSRCPLLNLNSTHQENRIVLDNKQVGGRGYIPDQQSVQANKQAKGRQTGQEQAGLVTRLVQGRTLESLALKEE